MSNTFSLEPMFHLLRSLTHGASLAPVLGLGLMQMGCGESTDIRGRAVATIVSEATGMIDKAYVMDTGSTGTDTVEAGEDWDITCSAGSAGTPHVTLTDMRLADGTQDGFYQIFLKEHDGTQDTSQEANVAVMLGPYYYTGFCEVTFDKTNDEPYEADVRSAVCPELKTRSGFPARLESASFHVKCCEGGC
ncbi:hypothetical protein [Sorangium sp. So ce1153]|uniref:hypothetical protein n=1 Tax=Sorangium sp. So ce1153 TaxID=3133333 RepID=UPI003F62195F